MNTRIRFLVVLLFLPQLTSSQSLWQSQNSNIPSSEMVLVFSPVNDLVCWACTVDTLNAAPSGYIRTTDGGTTWAYARISGAGGGIIGQIAALDADTAYAAVYVLSPSNTAGVYKTTNGGSTWTKQNAYGPSTSRYGPGAIHFFDANNGVVVGTWHPETYTTSDAGQHWNAVAMPPAYSTEYEQSEMVFAGDCAWFVTAGAGTRVFRTTNRGYTWYASTVGSQGSNWFPCLAFQDSHTGIYSEKVQETLVPHHYRKTTDGGATWTSLSSAILDSIAPTGVRYIPGTNATYLISGGMNAGSKGLAITYDAGENWKLIDPSGALYLGFASVSVGWCSPRQHNNGVQKYVWRGLHTFASAPSVPILVSPGNGATLQPTSLFLSWRLSPDALAYRLQIADDLGFNNPQFNDPAVTDTTKLVDNLLPDRKYFWRVKATNAGDSSLYSTAWDFTTGPDDVQAVAGIPTHYSLDQNYPNPFNPNSNIRYQISEFTQVRLAVYDLLGRELATLVNDKKAPGNYMVTFDGSHLASGVYLYRLQSRDFVMMKKMLLLK